MINLIFIEQFLFVYSNNMLYPKEDKENKVLLYAVSFNLFYYICFQNIINVL